MPFQFNRALHLLCIPCSSFQQKFSAFYEAKDIQLNINSCNYMRLERELMMIMKIGIHDDGDGDKIPGPRV